MESAPGPGAPKGGESAPGPVIIDTQHLPITDGVVPGSLTTIEDWWGILGGMGQAGPGSINYGDIRFPLSHAIAATDLLPVCYGAVRIGGAQLFVGNPAGDEFLNGTFVIAWCQGEIEAVDAFYCNGQPLTQLHLSDTGTAAKREFTHYMGAAGDSLQNGSGNIFGNPNWVGQATDASGLQYASYTRMDLYRATFVGGQWWLLLPGGAQDSTTFEWAADVRGLKIYDPRGGGSTAYSTNPALIVADILTRYGGLRSTDVDWTSIAAAADACDTQGFTCNIGWATKTLISDALAAVLQTCNGGLINANGKTGLFLDATNSNPPAATLLEEDGDIWGLKYEWLSATTRYTRMAVAFNNKDADYKADQTPDIVDPGVALGTVPDKAIVITSPGTNTMAAAIILRDYLFNRQVITFRVSGTMNSRGILLQQGNKVRLTTLKGVNTDFLLNQIATDAQGFFSFVAQPYDADVYGSTPISVPPPIVPVSPNPTTPGSDITVTDSSGERQVLASSGSTTSVFDVYQLIQYVLPSGGPALKELRVRGFTGTGALSKTWDDMAASQVVIPLTGNEPPPDASHFMLSVPGVIKTVRTLTFTLDGQLEQTVDVVGPSRIIIKTVTTADATSTGVTIDTASSTTTTPNSLVDIARYKWVPSTQAADGSRKTFAVPDKWCPGTLFVVADGMVLVDTSFSPAQGADYSVSGLNVVLDTAKSAPINYVAFLYQKSVVP